MDIVVHILCTLCVYNYVYTACMYICMHICVPDPNSPMFIKHWPEDIFVRNIFNPSIYANFPKLKHFMHFKQQLAKKA